MTTLLVTHPACSAHDMGEGHPERPQRLRAVDQALEDETFQLLARDVAPRVAIEALTRVHPLDYVEAIRRASPTQGAIQLDSDTAMSPGTLEAALRSAGGATFAVDEVVTRRVDNAFVATRPPGHHAEAATPMGFCFFNNAAVAARHAQAAHGVERVAIVDFDVHHGNGTQDIFWNDRPSCTLRPTRCRSIPAPARVARPASTTRSSTRRLRAGDGGDVFRDAFETAILPRLDDFAPDLLIISAGFDAHFRDPLGGLNLSEADFAWVTERLVALAARRCGGRVVSLLEGGYDLEGLARSAAAHVGALMRG